MDERVWEVLKEGKGPLPPILRVLRTFLGLEEEWRTRFLVLLEWSLMTSSFLPYRTL